MNIKSNNGTIQTINLINLATQLNELTDILNGTSGGTISDTQLNSINNRVTDIKKNLDDFKVDVERFIDETELQVKLLNIDNTLSSKVDNNIFITNINSITSQLSTISGQLSTLSSSLSNMNLSNYYDKLQTEAKIIEMIHDNITLIESAWKNDIVRNITTDIESKLNIFKDDITDTVKNEVEGKLITLKTEIENGVDNKFKEYKKISEYTQEMTNYARVDQLNNFRENITLDKNLNVSGTFTGNGMNIGSNKIISYDTELKLGNQSLPLNILSNGNIKINGSEIDFNNLNSLNFATEQKNGIAKLYSNAETEDDSDKVKEIIEKNTGNNEESPGKTKWAKLFETLDHTKILTARGLVKFLSKLLKPATENEYGLVNFQTIKQVSPKPDLSPYQLKSNFWKYPDSNLKVVGTNSSNGHSYIGMEIEMFNSAGDYTGSFHTNGGRAYYKVPNRNSGGWNEIMDNHDMAVRDNRITDAWNKANDAQLNRIQDVRLAGYINVIVWSQNKGFERNGYVVTGVLNDNADTDIDRIQMRALQILRNGQWLNTPFA